MNDLLDMCWMPVEPEWAPNVKALLAELRAGAAAHLDEAEPGPGEPGIDGVRAGGSTRRSNNEGGSVWPAEYYDQFMGARRLAYQRVRAFGDVLAAAPGREFPTSEACAEAGLAPSQVRQALGKFSQWKRAVLDEAVEWPFGWKHGENPDNPFEYYYRMSAEQAAAWRAARERTPEPMQ